MRESGKELKELRRHAGGWSHCSLVPRGCIIDRPLAMPKRLGNHGEEENRANKREGIIEHSLARPWKERAPPLQLRTVWFVFFFFFSRLPS